MNIAAYHKQQRQLSSAQSSYDHMSDPAYEDDGEECIDCDVEPDFESMLEDQKSRREE